MLSAYRLMWLMVMFDLPVVSPEQRKAAATFRYALLDLGFSMAQWSVYLRFCSSDAQSQTLMRQVQGALPAHGRVSLLQFTDKQYERIVHFSQGQRLAVAPPPPQFDLF